MCKFSLDVMNGLYRLFVKKKKKIGLKMTASDDSLSQLSSQGHPTAIFGKISVRKTI